MNAKIKREAWTNRLKREAVVKKALLNNEAPSISNISKALNLSSTIVTKEVLNLCAAVETKLFDMPVPHSSYVNIFSKEVSSENSKIKIPGCYYIFNIDNVNLGTYVGQSINLGKRVKDHAKGTQKSTKDLVKSDNCKVLIYYIDIIILPPYINLKIFLSILEQYLFFIHKPTKNISIIASAGYSNLSTINQKHIDKVGKFVYVYWFFNNKYYFLHSYATISSISFAFNISRKWGTNIISRGGFFREQLYLSTTLINNSLPLSISEPQLIILFNWLTLQKSFKSINCNCIKVLNIQDNSMSFYINATDTAKALNCDITSIYPNRDKPLKKKYFFFYVDRNTYIFYKQKPPFAFIKNILFTS